MSDPTKISRRLVAVFAADVEGYSRLMGADEVGTLKGLTDSSVVPRAGSRSAIQSPMSKSCDLSGTPRSEAELI